MKDFTDFLIFVFCFVEDFPKNNRLRPHGPQPTLSDSEVLTIEMMDAFLGLCTYFRRHWGDWFPALRRIHRTTFVRQAANLIHIKVRLWQALLPYDRAFSLVDSTPLPGCRLDRCRRFAAQASYGYDEQTGVFARGLAGGDRGRGAGSGPCAPGASGRGTEHAKHGLAARRSELVESSAAGKAALAGAASAGPL